MVKKAGKPHGLLLKDQTTDYKIVSMGLKNPMEKIVFKFWMLSLPDTLERSPAR